MYFATGFLNKKSILHAVPTLPALLHQISFNLLLFSNFSPVKILLLSICMVKNFRYKNVPGSLSVVLQTSDHPF